MVVHDVVAVEGVVVQLLRVVWADPVGLRSWISAVAPIGARVLSSVLYAKIILSLAATIFYDLICPHVSAGGTSSRLLLL